MFSRSRSCQSKEQGFSLIELLFVVVIISVIAAIAIPNLVRARHQANASSAIQSLRTINTAQHHYRTRHRIYASMESLVEESLIDSSLGSGHKSAYTFLMELGPDAVSYTANANPDAAAEGLDFFFIDETGVIRVESGAPAGPGSNPIPR